MPINKRTPTDRDICTKLINPTPKHGLPLLLTDKLHNGGVSFYDTSRGFGNNGPCLSRFSHHYTYRMLARITSFIGAGVGQKNWLPSHVDYDRKNPISIKHTWADHYADFWDGFATSGEFKHTQKKIPSLLFMRTGINRRLSEKQYLCSLRQNGPSCNQHDCISIQKINRSLFDPNKISFFQTSILFFKTLRQEKPQSNKNPAGIVYSLR